MQSRVEKVETQVNIKASAKQFYDVFCSKAHQIAKFCPEQIKGVEVHEGEWLTEGSFITWNYVLDGKAGAVKEVIEAIDKENDKIIFKVIEGDLLQDYKSYKFILQVNPQENGSVVHWIIEYEKLKDHIPVPHSMKQLLIEISNDIDAHLAANQK